MPNWNQVLNEITQQQQKSNRQSIGTLDFVRRKYLKQLHKYVNRNIICYYSGFLSKPANFGIELNDEDKNGFMMAIHKLDRRIGLDLFLHTPGGSIASAETIVDYLKKMFGKDIRAVVPQIAMSAGTMIACSCRSILMSNHSNLGPIDPQLRGVAALGVKEEFQRAIKEITDNPAHVHVWQFIISQYTPTFLGECENAVERAKQFVRSQLEQNMLEQHPNRMAIAEQIVDKFMDFSGNKGHDRHIHAEECKSIGLSIEMMEADQKLQDLILTVHHCYMHALMNTPAIKIVENHNGSAFVKNVLN